MGLFDKLFGKKEAPQHTKINSADTENSELAETADMLDEDLFWSILDTSLQNFTNQDEQEQVLIQEIENLTPKEMVGFRLRTDKLLYDTYTSEMWCAGYLMNGGCSDDGFEY